MVTRGDCLCLSAQGRITLAFEWPKPIVSDLRSSCNYFSFSSSLKHLHHVGFGCHGAAVLSLLVLVLCDVHWPHWLWGDTGSFQEMFCKFHHVQHSILFLNLFHYFFQLCCCWKKSHPSLFHFYNWFWKVFFHFPHLLPRNDPPNEPAVEAPPNPLPSDDEGTVEDDLPDEAHYDSLEKVATPPAVCWPLPHFKPAVGGWLVHNGTRSPRLC